MECGWEIAGAATVGKSSRSSSLLEEVILDRIVDELLLDVCIDDPKSGREWDDSSEGIDEYVDSLLPRDDHSALGAFSQGTLSGVEGDRDLQFPQTTHSPELNSAGDRLDLGGGDVQAGMLASDFGPIPEIASQLRPIPFGLDVLSQPPRSPHAPQGEALAVGTAVDSMEGSIPGAPLAVVGNEPAMGQTVPDSTFLLRAPNTAEEPAPSSTSQADSSVDDEGGLDTDCSNPKWIVPDAGSGESSGDCEETKAKSAPASVQASPNGYQKDLFGLLCRRDDCGVTKRISPLRGNADSPDRQSKNENRGWRGKDRGQAGGEPKALCSPSSKMRSLFVDAIRELAKQQKAEMVERVNEEKGKLERISWQAHAEREERFTKEKAARLEEERQKAAREEEARKAREAEQQKAMQQEAERMHIVQENERRKASEAESQKAPRESVWRSGAEPGKQKKCQEEGGSGKGAGVKSGLDRQCSGDSKKSTSTAVVENDVLSDDGSDPFRRDMEWGWSEEISEGEELIQTRCPPPTNEKQQTKDTRKVATKGRLACRPSGGKATKQGSTREVPLKRIDSGRNPGRVQNVGGISDGVPKPHLVKTTSKKAKKAKAKRRHQSERESVGSNESVTREQKSAIVTRSSSRSPVLVVSQGTVVRPGVSSPPPDDTHKGTLKLSIPPTSEATNTLGPTGKYHTEVACTGTQTSVRPAPPPMDTEQKPRPRYSITYKAAVQKAIVMASGAPPPPPPPDSPPSPAPPAHEDFNAEMRSPLNVGPSPPRSPELAAVQPMSTPSPNPLQMIQAFPPWVHYPPVGIPVPTLPHPIQPYWSTYCGLFRQSDTCESEVPIPNEEDLWAGDMETQERELAFAKKCQPILREEYKEMVAEGRHLPWRRC